MKGSIGKRIAVIGVSRKEDKFGFKIFRDLIKNEYDVVGVNPTNGEICKRKIYRNLSEVNSPIDLVITVTPAQVTERIAEECKELGIKEIWMQPGSESQKAINKAEEYKIKTTHNACFMVHEGIW